MTGDVSSHRREAINEYLQQRLEQHLELRHEFIQSQDLAIELTRLTEAHRALTFAARIHGILNGDKFDCCATARRSEVRGVSVGGGLEGEAIGFVVTTTIKTAARVAFGNFSDDDLRIMQCAEEVSSRLLLEVDYQLNVPLSPLGLRWRRLLWLRRGAALAVMVAVIATVMQGFISQGRSPGLAAFCGLLLMSAMAAAPTYALLLAISILAMPAAFFSTELEGRRAVARSGVDSTGKMKAVAVVLTLTLASMASYAVWLWAFGEPSR